MAIPDSIDDASANPLISVCVPMYNNGKTIERCLHSILDQDGVEFEIVVVDDQSTDDSGVIAATMLRAGDRLVSNDSRLGLNGNHNRCLELARGDYIQFVHGDDWLLPGALRTLAQCFDNPNVGLAFAPRRVQAENLPKGSRQQVPSNLHTMFARLRESNHGPSLVLQIVGIYGASANLIGEPTCVMFRRRLALDVGGVRTDIHQTVDLDFWLRLMLRSSVRFVPQELSVRCHTADTETAHIKGAQRHWLDQLRILTWMIVDPASTNVIRIIATVWWIARWLTLLLTVTLFGPRRQARLKILALAPVREFAHARRLRIELMRQPAQAQQSNAPSGP